MEAPTAADTAHFEAWVKAELTYWFANCPAECKAKAQARPEAEQEEEFMATWAAADTDGDNLLNAAEFQDLCVKMSANELAYNGFVEERDAAKNTEFFNLLMAIAPAGAAGVSQAEFGRYFAVMMAIYPTMS